MENCTAEVARLSPPVMDPEQHSVSSPGMTLSLSGSCACPLPGPCFCRAVLE